MNGSGGLEQKMKRCLLLGTYVKRCSNLMLAFDVTQEYQLTGELREKQKIVQKINRRLKALNSSIQYIIMDKETLHTSSLTMGGVCGKIELLTAKGEENEDNTCFGLAAPPGADEAYNRGLHRRIGRC